MASVASSSLSWRTQPPFFSTTMATGRSSTSAVCALALSSKSLSSFWAALLLRMVSPQQGQKTVTELGTSWGSAPDVNGTGDGSGGTTATLQFPCTSRRVCSYSFGSFVFFAVGDACSGIRVSVSSMAHSAAAEPGSHNRTVLAFFGSPASPAVVATGGGRRRFVRASFACAPSLLLGFVPATELFCRACSESCLHFPCGSHSCCSPHLL